MDISEQPVGKTPDGRMPPSRIKLTAHVQTDVGVVRDHNEDSAHVDERTEFFVVADGMGGHAAGEVASKMAVELVRDHLAENRPLVDSFYDLPNEDARKSLITLLETAVRRAHQSVYETGARESDKQGMGTTLDVVLVAGNEAFVAHVGDSRTYLVRDGKASRLTTDHTVAEVLVIEGKLSPEEAQVSPLRTILVNAIGVAPDVGVEMAHVKLTPGDRILLCSDGLHDYFPADQELADQVGANEPEAALSGMVELAKDRGGHDNITGVLLEILELPELPVVEEESDPDPTASIHTTETDIAAASEDTQPVSDAHREALENEDTPPGLSAETMAEARKRGPDDETVKMKAVKKEPAGKPRAADADTVKMDMLSDEDKPKKKKKKRRRRKKKAGDKPSAKPSDGPEALGDTIPGRAKD